MFIHLHICIILHNNYIYIYMYIFNFVYISLYIITYIHAYTCVYLSYHSFLNMLNVYFLYNVFISTCRDGKPLISGRT